MLKYMGLWHEKKLTIRNYFQIIFVYTNVYVCGYGVTALTIREMIYGVDDLGAIVEGGIGVLDTVGMIYMKYCFIRNLKLIQKMVVTVQDFQEFCPMYVIENAEKNVQKYTKGFFAYAFIGNLLNTILTIIDKPNCKETRDLELEKRDPCGTTIRGYWPFDVNYFPLSWIIFYVDLHSCVTISFVAFAITTFLIGTLVHTIAQLEYCRKLLKRSCEYSDEKDALECINFCVKYHQKIIEFSQTINQAFSSQMLLHVTVTSFVISILGFQILTVNNFEHSFRFSLHLFGWSFFLYVTCFFAQKLIDESLLIGHDAYTTPWYNKCVPLQKKIKLIMLRSQKPLTLNAINLGIISLRMFLLIMKSAYSYFTLLLNLRK